MTRWFTFLICGVLACAGLTGCSEEVSAPAPAQNKSVAAKPPVNKVPPPQVKEEVKQEVEFVYLSEGRRDPFVPLTSIKKPVNFDSNEPETPLQKYDVVQLTVVGVIVGKGEPKALVIAPNGKSYVLAKGVRVGKSNGVVIDINNEAISIEEKYYDFSNNINTRIEIIAVPKREGV